MRPDITIDLFVICNAADDAATRERGRQLGDGFAGRFFDAPEGVAESIIRLGELGIGRVQLAPVDPGSLDRLAPLLFG